MVSDNAGEHYAESASCSDHSGDANKMVTAGLPREEIRRIIDDAMNSAIPEPWEVIAHATARLEALFAPILAEKEREIERLTRRALQAIDEREAALARALAAEADSEQWQNLFESTRASLQQEINRLERELASEKERADLAVRQMVKQNNRLAALAQIAAPGAAMEAP